jgi:hypothetical protein
LKLADPNLRAAIARLTPQELRALEALIRTGQRTRAAIDAIHRLKQILKAIVRGKHP